MSRLFHESQPQHDPRLALRDAAPATVRAPADRDEATLGFECADPTLQIERWGQETHPMS